MKDKFLVTLLFILLFWEDLISYKFLGRQNPQKSRNEDAVERYNNIEKTMGQVLTDLRR